MSLRAVIGVPAWRKNILGQVDGVFLTGINIIGMDVVEVAPAYDVGEITALAASHIAHEMLYLCASRPGSHK